ncbi:unnamed protein product, partial [marine sediment metagenome]
MPDDQDIASEFRIKPIDEIAAKLGIAADNLEKYGLYKAKLSPEKIENLKSERGKLILATAMSPTPAGEGKTTISIGLADAFNRLG